MTTIRKSKLSCQWAHSKRLLIVKATGNLKKRYIAASYNVSFLPNRTFIYYYYQKYIYFLVDNTKKLEFFKLN